MKNSRTHYIKHCGACVSRMINNKVWTKLLQREATSIKMHQNLISGTPQLNNACNRASNGCAFFPTPPLHPIHLQVPVFEPQLLNYFLHFVYLLSAGWNIFCKINITFVICIGQKNHVETYTGEREEDNSYTEAWFQNNLWEKPRWLLSKSDDSKLPVLLLTTAIHNTSKCLQHDTRSQSQCL